MFNFNETVTFTPNRLINLLNRGSIRNCAKIAQNLICSRNLYERIPNFTSVVIVIKKIIQNLRIIPRKLTACSEIAVWFLKNYCF